MALLTLVVGSIGASFGGAFGCGFGFGIGITAGPKAKGLQLDEAIVRTGSPSEIEENQAAVVDT